MERVHDQDNLLALPLFSGVAEAIARQVLSASELRDLARQSVLLLPGQGNRHLHVLLAGRLRLHVDSPFGEPLSFVDAGEAVGGSCVFEGGASSAYVIADADSTILSMPDDALRHLVENSPAAAWNLLSVLSRQLKKSNALLQEKMRAQETFYHYGTIDPLTGLYNRYWLEEMLPRQIMRSRVGGRTFTLILVDIDNFMVFNDSHGHICGDLAIGTLAGIIRESLRPTDIIARYGGDRFVIVLPDVDQRHARVIAERLRQRVMYFRFFSPDGTRVSDLTISIGIVQGEPEETPEQLLERGMTAVRRAKSMGRNYVSD